MPIFDIVPPKKEGRKIESLKEKEEKEKIEKEKKLSLQKNKTKKVILLLGIFSLFLGILFLTLHFGFAEKQFTKNFYPTRCEGEWQNPGNAASIPDVSFKGSFNDFSEKNSAVYRGGASELMCKWFDENPKEKEKQTENLCGNNNQNCKISQAKIYLSFAIDREESQEKNQDQDTSLTTLPTETQGIKNQTQEVSDLDTKIILWYSTDHGKTWNSFGKITTLPLSNYINQGYISFDAPFIKSWQDIENLRVMFEGAVGGEQNIVAFLDSVWVEAGVVEKKEVVPGEIFQKIISIFDRQEKQEELSLKTANIQKEIEYEIPSDGKIIAKINNLDGTIGGIFRIYFFSEDNKPVGTLWIMSGFMKNFQGYSLPEIKTGNFYSKDFESKEESTAQINVKESWGKTKIRIEYIPIIEDKEGKEINLDNLELSFSPQEIFLDDANFLGEVVFEGQEKGEKEINLKNQNGGELIAEVVESGEGGSGALLASGDLIFGGIEFSRDVKEIVSLGNVSRDTNIIKIRHIDLENHWEDNKGKRIIKLYLREKND